MAEHIIESLNSNIGFLTLAISVATENMPTVSILAAMIGTPKYFRLLWTKVYSLIKSTSLRLLSVLLFGLMRTSLKSSLTSLSILGILKTIGQRSNLIIWHRWNRSKRVRRKFREKIINKKKGLIWTTLILNVVVLEYTRHKTNYFTGVLIRGVY